ncbi:MAG: arginase family protein [Gammaproteobacteria bacterium]|nr:arginase family protein [Gammaproteobacteria bacterium]
MSVLQREPDVAFCGVPFSNADEIDADIAVVGAPHGTPYKPGTPSHAANGADAVRAALSWYSTGREQMDFDSLQPVFAGASIVDLGNVTEDLEDGRANRACIENATRAALAQNAKPILLGGDDSVPIPFIQALDEQYKEVTVVQVDAHLDWRHEVDGVTHGFSSTMRRASEMDHVRNMIQIGARGPGSARRQDCEDAVAWGAKIFTARDIHRNGFKAALKAVPRHAPVVLSIDVDGIDPSVVPGVILPAFGGLGYQQMLDIIQGIAERTTIVAADFVEFVPEQDLQSRGAQAIARLACNVITAMARQR